MKSSKCVPLLIIGSLVTLYGCRQNENRDLQQQSYNSLAECTNDWGESRNCTTSTSGGGHGSAYYGPRYYWDREIGKPVAISPDGQTRAISGTRLSSTGSASGMNFHAGSTVVAVRSGFGSFGRNFSMGG